MTATSAQIEMMLECLGKLNQLKDASKDKDADETARLYNHSRRMLWEMYGDAVKTEGSPAATGKIPPK